jgi:hypothetical protein
MRISLPKNRLPALILAPALLLIFSATLSVSAQASASPFKEDTQQWNDVQVSVPLNKEIDFTLSSTLRFGRNVTHLVERRVGVGFSFKVGKYLTLAPSYVNLVVRPTANRKNDENRLSFAATLSVPFGKFVFSDRNTFERRIRTPLNSTRYRNRLQLEHPVKFGKTALQLFVSDEVFYDWSFDGWVRNRFAVGLSRRFNRHFTGDFYYMRQTDGRSRPGDLNIIGATYRIRL